MQKWNMSDMCVCVIISSELVARLPSYGHLFLCNNADCTKVVQCLVQFVRLFILSATM
jgi:hypothetical protein